MSRRNAKAIPKPVKSRAALTITHPNAAGIGSASHFVAVPPDRDGEPVREFPSFTVDLNALADWLRACGVDTVAMESIGKQSKQSKGPNIPACVIASSAARGTHRVYIHLTHSHCAAYLASRRCI